MNYIELYLVEYFSTPFILQLFEGVNPETSQPNFTSKPRHYLFDPTCDLIYNPWYHNNGPMENLSDPTGQRDRDSVRMQLVQGEMSVDSSCFVAEKN